MKRYRNLIAVIVLLLVLSIGASLALAQSGGGYDLTWNTVDGGGAMFSTGGSYSLGGTIGQADAGEVSGGAYTLAGGFWSGVAVLFGIYLPLIMK
jgi:hypothetical protein